MKHERSARLNPQPNAQTMVAVVRDNERLAAVEKSGLIDQPAPRIFEELATQVSKQLHAPIAVLTLVERYRDVILGQIGLPADITTNSEITIQPSFCALTVSEGETVIINDTHSDSYYRMFPSVSDGPVRAHLGVPLFYNGQPIGNICALDTEPREWTAVDIEALEGLGQQAMESIEAHGALARQNPL